MTTSADASTLPPAHAEGFADNGDIKLNYATFGNPEDPPILMIMGLGSSRVGWPPEFLDRLAGLGRYVITFDNRDVGLSTWLHEHETDMGAVVASLLAETPLDDAPYTLSHMAADAIAVLDELGVESAHVVGASMGGMIAQTVAIEYPERTRTLTSVFSMTGEAGVGMPTAEAAAALVSPTPTDRDGYIEATIERFKLWSAPEHWDVDELRERISREYDRAFNPDATTRQLAAILASGSRAELLPNVTAPALVIHGLADTLIQPDGGRRTAELLPEVEHLEIPDMGHELPRAHWDLVLDTVERHTKAARG